jgi:hypothetical protein
MNGSTAAKNNFIMSHIESAKRQFAIAKKLRERRLTLSEIQDYLDRKSEMDGYDYSNQ